MSIRLLPWFFAAASLAACTSSGASDSQAQDGELSGPVDYQSGGGLDGAGYHTAAHITADGAVVVPPSTDSRPLTNDERATLRTDIDNAGFPTLAPSYLSGTADDYLDTVKVEIDGTTYTVSADTRATIPSGLSRVIADLRQLSGTPPRRAGS